MQEVMAVLKCADLTADNRLSEHLAGGIGGLDDCVENDVNGC